MSTGEELTIASRALHGFRVCCPEDGSRPEAPNVRAIDVESAAEQWVERHHPDLDYADDVRVLLTLPDGRTIETHVRTRHDVSFRATVGAVVPESAAAHEEE